MLIFLWLTDKLLVDTFVLVGLIFMLFKKTSFGNNSNAMKVTLKVHGVVVVNVHRALQLSP